MTKVSFQIIPGGKITPEETALFIALLIEQGKVAKPSAQRIKNCLKIVVCKVDGENAGIGAIKPKTPSDFGPDKANLQSLTNDIKWELGYIYVKESFRGLGLSSTIVRLLLKDFEGENLIACTELNAANPMITVLKKGGFYLMGNPWKSNRHDGYLGLFVKFEKGK